MRKRQNDTQCFPIRASNPSLQVGTQVRVQTPSSDTVTPLWCSPSSWPSHVRRGWQRDFHSRARREAGVRLFVDGVDKVYFHLRRSGVHRHHRRVHSKLRECSSFPLRQILQGWVFILFSCFNQREVQREEREFFVREDESITNDKKNQFQLLYSIP